MNFVHWHFLQAPYPCLTASSALWTPFFSTCSRRALCCSRRALCSGVSGVIGTCGEEGIAKSPALPFRSGNARLNGNGQLVEPRDAALAPRSLLQCPCDDPVCAFRRLLGRLDRQVKC